MANNRAPAAPGSGGIPAGMPANMMLPQTPPNWQLGQALPALPGIDGGGGATLSPGQLNQQFGIPLGANGLPSANLMGWTPPKPAGWQAPTMNLPQTPPQIRLGQAMAQLPGIGQGAGASGQVPRLAGGGAGAGGAGGGGGGGGSYGDFLQLLLQSLRRNPQGVGQVLPQAGSTYY